MHSEVVQEGVCNGERENEGAVQLESASVLHEEEEDESCDLTAELIDLQMDQQTAKLPEVMQRDAIATVVVFLGDVDEVGIELEGEAGEAAAEGASHLTAVAVLREADDSPG
jgi:hypothetical protein